MGCFSRYAAVHHETRMKRCKKYFLHFLSAREARNKDYLDQVICHCCRHTKSWYSFKLGAEIRRESLYSIATWPLHLTVRRQSVHGLLDLQNWRWTKVRTCEMTVCGSARPQWSLSARHLTSIPACPCTARPVPHSIGPSFKDVYIISWRDHRVGNALCIILQCEYFIVLSILLYFILSICFLQRMRNSLQRHAIFLD